MSGLGVKCPNGHTVLALEAPPGVKSGDIMDPEDAAKMRARQAEPLPCPVCVELVKSGSVIFWVDGE